MPTRMSARRSFAILTLAFAAGHAMAGDNLPIREVTIFKDGHAMVLRSGTAATDARGDVVLDELPLPILGTFWAFENTEGAALRSVRAGRVDETAEVEPGSMQDLLMLAVGEDVVLSLSDETQVAGRLTRVIGGGGTVLIESDGLVAVPMDQIRRVSFSNAEVGARKREEVRRAERLTIDLGWDESPAAEADVGMAYIQKGLRWIPSYRVTILDDDTARIELQATLVNELADLEDVSAHLVVGVPSFMFEHTLDPIGLQEQLADLGQYFRRADQSGNMFSNSLMAQTARMNETRGWGGREESGGGGQPELEVGGTESNEDLYVFHVDHVTLAKGERLVVPIAVAEVPFEPVYTLDLPVSPPTETWQHFSTDQQRQIAEMLGQPKATHVLRLTNTSEHPFTTAPALIVKDGRPLAQNMMRYTAKKAETDLEVTQAVDIRVESSAQETGRDPESVHWNGNAYARIDLEGLAEITNYKDRAIRLEVTRHALGLADDVSEGGSFSQVDFFTDLDWVDPAFQWTRWYGWPWWWSRLNGAAKFEWTLDLEPGEKVELKANWHYLWR